MSIESARAFCMRMMSDDEFRENMGKAESADQIREIIKKDNYDFSKHDLLKIVSELTGKKLEADQLEDMVCGIYAEEVAGSDNANAIETVRAWFRSL